MTYILIPVLIVLIGLVVYSLVRGIVAFLNATKDDLNHTGSGPTESQLFQNKMMFNRIKYQALAVVVVGVLLLLAR